MGGTPLEKYCIVPASRANGRQVVDAIIVTDSECRTASEAEYRSLGLGGRDLIVVNTSAGRLGMYLLGDVLFSREVIKERFALRSVRTVALCTGDDAVLRPLAERFGIEVVVDDQTSPAEDSP